VLLLIAVLNIGLLVGWTYRRRLLVLAAGLAPLAVELAIFPTSTVPIPFVLAPAAALSEVAVLRGRGRPSLHPAAPAPTRAWLIAVMTLTLAGAAFRLGRSGSPLCHPESILQWHAVWHVLVAISAVAFAHAAFDDTSDPRAARLIGTRGPGGAART
jgi:hypothetical protein